MLRRENEKKVCRFCLDDKNEKKNPFLSPCKCKGSIEFVHLYCLNRWRNQNLEQNYKACSLCHTNYSLPNEYSLEQVPKPNIYLIVLEYPILTNLTVHYVWGVTIGMTTYRDVNIIGSYYYLQVFYNLYYISSMIFRFRVLKQTRYLNLWKQQARYLFFPFYLALLLISFQTYIPFSWITTNFVMTMFWHTHLQILHQMNLEDLQNLRQEYE